MRRITYERALHMWPEWGESIARSRDLLGYDPKWGLKKRDKWIERNYFRVKELGLAELKRLELPLNLMQYWQDCFYSDYESSDGIVNYDRITRRLSDIKSLPELPYDCGLRWNEGEDTTDPWLRIEIRFHGGFATNVLFQDATKNAWDAIMDHITFPTREIPEHPVIEYIDRAKVKTPRLSVQVLELWNLTGSIDDTLNRLFFSPEIQADLQAELTKTKNSYERRLAEQRFRKRFRDRVTAVLRRSSIKYPKPKSSWWSRN